MNKVLKTLLQVGEAVAKNTVPGGALIVDGVDALINKRTDAAVPEMSVGVIQFIESIKQTDVANEALFEAGLEQVRQGYHLIKMSLKDHTDGTPVTAPAPVAPVDPAPTV